MKPVLRVGRNALVRAEAQQSALLIDARDYYRTLYRALEQAQSYAIVSGWQFESGIPLLRGEDAEHTAHPVKFLEFLQALCDERPGLTIYLLAWDFSVVYAKDREWGQAEKFNGGNPQVRFVWDAHPTVGASHHQKFAVIDGAVGFIGGIDLCDARWDENDHRSEHPERVNVVGDPCKPYHDVQACFTGAIVAPLVEVFVERWLLACGERLQFAPPAVGARDRFDLMALSGGCAHSICATHAALSRTRVDSRAEPARVGEVFALFGDAIRAARRLIYAETQYFTSRSVAKLLFERMRDDTLPKLDIVVVLPHGADTPMEKMALEDTQDGVLSALLETALECGHELRLIYPASRNPDGSETATFIHSKILIVDDELLMVGSPNLTERSIALDTELAITWECNSEADELTDCIQTIRTLLLAEHSGLPASEFGLQRGLCEKVGLLIERGDTRLRRREVVAAGPLGDLLSQFFDPGDAELTDATALLEPLPRESRLPATSTS